MDSLLLFLPSQSECSCWFFSDTLQDNPNLFLYFYFPLSTNFALKFSPEWQKSHPSEMPNQCYPHKPASAKGSRSCSPVPRQPPNLIPLINSSVSLFMTSEIDSAGIVRTGFCIKRLLSIFSNAKCLLAASDPQNIEWPIFKYSIPISLFLPRTVTQWTSSHLSLVLFNGLQWIIFQKLDTKIILMQSKLSRYELHIHPLIT